MDLAGRGEAKLLQWQRDSPRFIPCNTEHICFAFDFTLCGPRFKMAGIWFFFKKSENVKLLHICAPGGIPRSLISTFFFVELQVDLLLYKPESLPHILVVVNVCCDYLKNQGEFKSLTLLLAS